MYGALLPSFWTSGVILYCIVFAILDTLIVSAQSVRLLLFVSFE